MNALLMESLGWRPLARFRGSFPRAGPGEFVGSQNPLAFSQEAELERLEREFAIQSQITEAARRLASDPNVSKKLKKQRKTSYLNALKKLQEIENAINEYRIKSGKKPTQRASLIIDGKRDIASTASRKVLWRAGSKILALEAQICAPSSSLSCLEASMDAGSRAVLSRTSTLVSGLCAVCYGCAGSQHKKRCHAVDYRHVRKADCDSFVHL